MSDNNNQCIIHIEAHIDCDGRIGNLYKKNDDEQYELIERNYDKPSFSDFYMYDHDCFQWNIMCKIGESITLVYIDSLKQSYKKKITCNKHKINYLLSLKENWKTSQVTYDISKF